MDNILDDIVVGDARRCKFHPHVITSSPDGMFDTPCHVCEYMIECVFDEEPVPPTIARTNASMVPDDPNTILF